MTTGVPPLVVVGVDDVLDCRAALSFAAHEAAATPATVQVLHVCDSAESSAGHEHPSDLDPARRLVQELAPRVAVTAALAAGPVDQTFVDRSRDAALVVVEHRRRSRLARYRRPSTAAMLAGRVHCPLVAVPEDWHARPRSTGVITIGIDAVDHETETLLERGFSLAAREGARLRLGHAWTMSSPYDDAVVDAVIEKDWSEAYQTRLERLLAPYRQAQPAVEVSVEVVHRRPADALVTWSQASDMVLLGRGRLVHPLVDGLGSVPRAVLEDGCCPIAVAAP